MKPLLPLAIVSLLALPLLAAPTTAPAPEKVQALVAQLGDKDFATREAASRELEAMGPAIHPALKEAAAKAADAEVSTRLETILRKHEESLAKAGDLVDADPVGPEGCSSSTSVSQTNNVKTIMAQVPNRWTRIVEDRDGIAMDVTTTCKGKEVKQQFKAANADELKKQAPKAHAHYRELSDGQCGIQINVQGGGGFGIIKMGEGVIRLVPATQPEK